MSTTSKIPKIWADKPWPILVSPQGKGQDIKSHYSVYIATDMCHAHNMFIRAMNSIYIQSPNVTSPTDIADLLFFAKTLVMIVDAHHEHEEKFFFPDLAELTGNPKIMSINEAQHEAFHAGIVKFGEYCSTTSPTDYSHATFTSLFEAFANPLHKHLADEIPSILALKDIPSKDLRIIWEKLEKSATSVGSFDEMFPLAFGCIDAGYEGRMHRFPPVPGFVSYVVKYWFARKHQGAWRFNPCDMWGVPRELTFLPKVDTVTE